MSTFWGDVENVITFITLVGRRAGLLYEVLKELLVHVANIPYTLWLEGDSKETEWAIILLSSMNIMITSRFEGLLQYVDRENHAGKLYETVEGLQQTCASHLFFHFRCHPC